MREDILNEAKQLICGDRNAQYGEPTQDFQRTADLWSTEFGELLGEGRRFEPHHVAVAMILLKASRIAWSPGKRDHWVDIAGYAACGAECAAENVEKDTAAGWDDVYEINPFSVGEWVVAKQTHENTTDRGLMGQPQLVERIDGPMCWLYGLGYYHHSRLELANVQADEGPDTRQTMDATVHPDLG